MKKSTIPTSRAYDDAREVFWALVQRGAPVPVRNQAAGMERLERARRLRSSRRASSAARKTR